MGAPEGGDVEEGARVALAGLPDPVHALPVPDDGNLEKSALLPGVGFTHCLNPGVRIRKKLQEKSEAAMRTPMKRASKQAPT